MRRHAKAAAVGSIEGGGGGRARFRRAVAAAGATVALGLLGASNAAAAEAWGFEQVTPVGKGAGTVSYVDTYRTSPDGESLLYTANSPFSSIPAESSPAYTRYIGRRGADGWNNRPLDPPYDAGTGTGAAFDITGVIGSSYNLDYVLVSSTYALTPGATEGGGNLYMRDTRSNELKLVATSPNRVLSSVFTGLLGPTAVNYVAPDGKAAIFTAPVALVPGAPEGSGNALAYSWSESGGIELLSQLPNGEIVTGGGGGNGSENGSRESMAYEGGLDHTYFSYVNESGFQGVFVRSGGVSKAVSYSRDPRRSPGSGPGNRRRGRQRRSLHAFPHRRLRRPAVDGRHA